MRLIKGIAFTQMWYGVKFDLKVGSRSTAKMKNLVFWLSSFCYLCIYILLYMYVVLVLILLFLFIRKKVNFTDLLG